jgi:hypothetical protein
LTGTGVVDGGGATVCVRTAVVAGAASLRRPERTRRTATVTARRKAAGAP